MARRLSQAVVQPERVATTCPYCGVGCGVSATRLGSELIATDGDDEHPANAGRLCVKGVALKDTVTLEGRLLAPQVNGDTTDWDTALEVVASGFSEVIEQYGPDAVAFYLSGQLLTEDYYVANKLMKGFIGSGNVDTNSRLCMASAVAGYKRAFGEDVVPCDYADLEECDLLVLVGSNAAWTHPVLYQRISAAKAKRGFKVVVIDPRITATCELADLHLRLLPGSDADLFVGLLDHLVATGALDELYVDQHTNDFEQCKEVAAGAARRCAAATGIAAKDIETFLNWFSATEKVVTLYSQGVNQSESGTDKCNAIINCHLATGRIGKLGMGPFSITGQPNAMGGREVGGMANQLAAHMDFTEDHIVQVGRFWNAPRMARSAGLKAVDMFTAIERGDIKAVWIMGTNPVVSLPQADRVKRALENCPLVVVSDCVADTDTTAFANVLLPAAPWGEKDGTVTNSERCISRQRAVFPLSGSAKPDWDIVCALAAKLGYEDAFRYAGAHEIFSEHARLTRFAKAEGRQFDISVLAELPEEAYDNLQSVQWPIGQRPFHDGLFSTPNRKANFVAIRPRLPVQRVSSAYPFVLNTGRLRDQWHTMTRTGLAAKLFQHTPVPQVQANPDDLAAANITNGSLVELTNEQGFVRALVESSSECASGQLFMPIHWSEQYAWPARVSVLGGGSVDPVSGQPESKHVPVALREVVTRQWVAVASIESIDTAVFSALFWTRRPSSGVSRIDMALDSVLSVAALCQTLHSALPGLGAAATQTDRMVLEDSVGRQLRVLLLVNGAPVAVAVAATRWETLADASELLAGALAAPRPCTWRSLSTLANGADSSPVICTCFEVSRASIDGAIVCGATSVVALGARLRCGTNCGSCVPELSSILRQKTPAVG